MATIPGGWNGRKYHTIHQPLLTIWSSKTATTARMAIWQQTSMLHQCSQYYKEGKWNKGTDNPSFAQHFIKTPKWHISLSLSLSLSFSVSLFLSLSSNMRVSCYQLGGPVPPPTPPFPPTIIWWEHNKRTGWI